MKPTIKMTAEGGSLSVKADRPVLIGISREDVEGGRIEGALSVLRSMMSSPGCAASFKEDVDVTFWGYDDDPRPLWEIEEVRTFVARLDQEFPFWLFFLYKFGLGIQSILLCLLPPFVPDEDKSRTLKPKIYEILTTRWFPAMYRVCEYAGGSADDIERLSERTMSYIVHGRFRLERLSDGA